MEGVRASDAGSGHFMDPAMGAQVAQSATNIAGFNSDDTLLPLTGSRAYLDVSPAAGHPFYGGSEVVYTNGRYREHCSPRLGGRSRDNSAERSHGAANTPCSIMKVS